MNAKPEIRNQKPIVGIGAATLDHFVLVSEFPSGEGVSRALQTTRQGGGPVATALCALATLGARTELIDALGDDHFGRIIINELREFGVGTRRVCTHPGHTSAHAHILVRHRDGARHIIYMPATFQELCADDVDADLVRSAALLHLNGRHEYAARHAVALARESGVPVSFDGGAGRYLNSVRDLVLAADIRILARDFALHFAREDSLEAAAQVLLSDHPSMLVITDGANGCHVWPRNGGHFHQAAVAVDPIIDTTGCGDVFHGAFLYGWTQKWPWWKTAEFASKLAAETAGHLGGRGALRRLLKPKNAEARGFPP